ncbi:MAG: Trigger factor [bacterium ADurb.Bin400]|nr:MAG: Trigger factor [bacterium ADurb.Bin400]
MKVRAEQQGKSKIKLTVGVEQGELVPHFQAAYDELAPTVKLAGFRPGKAPRKMVEDALGITRLVTRGLDMAVQRAYAEAVQQEKVFPVSAPSISVTQYPSWGLSKDEIKDSLEFEAEVEVFPEVELGDYKKVKVEATKTEKTADKDVEKVLHHLQRQKSKLIDTDQPAEKGDFVEIDFEGEHKGVKLDKMSSKHFPLVIGEGSMIPGFEDNLVGLKKGEEKTFQIKFPKDYHDKELAGQDAKFTVKVLQQKKVEKPELNDEFAKLYGHDKMSELKKAIGDNLQMELDHKGEHELQEKVLDKVLPLLKVEVPETVLHREVHRLMEQFDAQLKSQGVDLDSYLKSMKKDVAAFEKEIEPQAERNVKIGFLLGQIVKEQGWQGNEAEMGERAMKHLMDTVVKKADSNKE